MRNPTIDFPNFPKHKQNLRWLIPSYQVLKNGETHPHLEKTYQYYDVNRLKSSTRNNYATHDRLQKYDFQGRLTEALTGAEARNETTIDREEIPYKQGYSFNAFGNALKCLALLEILE